MDDQQIFQQSRTAQPDQKGKGKATVSLVIGLISIFITVLTIISVITGPDYNIPFISYPSKGTIGEKIIGIIWIIMAYLGALIIITLKKLSIAFPIIGIIFGIFGVKSAKRKLAIAGIILSFISLIILMKLYFLLP